MSAVDFREPAFPSLIDLPPTASAEKRVGMSLRDYFAGQVMAGIGTWLPHYVNGTSDLHELAAHEARAKFCYVQADAMLEARK